MLQIYCKRAFLALASAHNQGWFSRSTHISCKLQPLYIVRNFSAVSPGLCEDGPEKSRILSDVTTSDSRRIANRFGQDHGDDKDDGMGECDRTFCPPERAEHCRIAHLRLKQPRGDESLMHQLDGGLQNLKRTLKCPLAYRALFVDAFGTLIKTSQSTQQIYHEIGLKYGVTLSEDEIAAKYKAAYGRPWCRYRMRYEDDGRLFWQRVVQEATGCKDPGLLEDLYQYYTTDKAWYIGDPDAGKALKAIKGAGFKLAVVSNFDTRLRPVMKVLNCYEWFDSIIVSAEVGSEKPNPEIFLTACRELDVKPVEVLHVGDDKTNDLVGASAAGCDSLLWGVEVTNFTEVAKKLGVNV